MSNEDLAKWHYEVAQGQVEFSQMVPVEDAWPYLASAYEHTQIALALQDDPVTAMRAAGF